MGGEKKKINIKCTYSHWNVMLGKTMKNIRWVSVNAAPTNILPVK